MLPDRISIEEVIELVDRLDGRGLIFTDDSLLGLALEEMGFEWVSPPPDTGEDVREIEGRTTR